MADKSTGQKRQITSSPEHLQFERLLNDTEARKAYVAASVESFNKDSDIGALMLALRTAAETQGSVREFAKKTGMSGGTIYRVLSEKGNPTIVILRKILNGFDLKLSIRSGDKIERLLKVERLLNDPEAIKEYVAASIESFNEDGDTGALMLALRNAVEAQGSISEFAKKTGICYGTISKEGNPTIVILKKILDGFDLKLGVISRDKIERFLKFDLKLSIRSRSIRSKDKIEKLLNDPEAIKECVAAFNKDSDIGALMLALRTAAETQGSIREFAKKTGIHQNTLYKVLSEKGNPRVDILKKILDGLDQKLGVR